MTHAQKYGIPHTTAFILAGLIFTAPESIYQVRDTEHNNFQTYQRGSSCIRPLVTMSLALITASAQLAARPGLLLGKPSSLDPMHLA